MASVKRVRGSAYWYACYRAADGTRRQESTGESDRGKALALALAYESAAAAARSGELSVARARNFLAQCAAISGTHELAGVPVGEWLGKWLENIGRRLKAKSAVRYRGVINSFVGHLGPTAKAPLHSIRPHDVAAWRDAIIASGRTPKTANIARAILHQAFAEAKAQHLIEANPCAGLAFGRADGGNTRRQPFTIDQFSRLLAAVDGEWRMFLLLLGLTGARQQEAAQLRWDQVDFARRTITLIRGKQRDKPHTVPMHPGVFSALDQAHSRAASVLVLPTLAAAPGKTLSKKFREQILPKIGIEQPYGGRDGGRVPSVYSLHSLRHSLSSWIDAEGMSPAQRRDMLGHESTLINERYTHANLAAIAEKLARIQIPPLAIGRAAN